MLELIKINKKFQFDFWKRPHWALQDLSFSLGEGEIIGYLGANGAGKTTSLKIIMGLVSATSGEIRFYPCLGKSRSEVLKNIGFLPERPYYYPHLTGKELIFYLGRLSEVSVADIKKRLDFWAQRFGIDYALDRNMGTYSKGMLQRLGLISCIIHDPKLIILDEPLSGLDPLGRREMKEAIMEIHKEGKTIFFSSHIVPDVEEICQKVIFLEKGKLIYEGGVEQLVEGKSEPIYIVQVSAQESQLSSFLRDPNQFEGIWEGMPFKRHNHFLNFKIPGASQAHFIQKLLHLNIPIERIEKQKLTLEEIFYKIKDEKNF